MPSISTIQLNSTGFAQAQNLIYDGLVDFEPFALRDKNLKKVIFKNCILNKLSISNMDVEELIIENCTIKGQLNIDFSSIHKMRIVSNKAEEINVGLGMDLNDLFLDQNSCPLNFKGRRSPFLNVSISSEETTKKSFDLDTSVFKQAFGA